MAKATETKKAIGPKEKKEQSAVQKEELKVKAKVKAVSAEKVLAEHKGQKTGKNTGGADYQFDPYRVIKRPLSTEKSIRQIEFENKLTFIIDAKSSKPEVKRAVEELFKVRVVKVNIQNSFNGEKRATVRLSAGNLASDVSAELGLI